MAQRDFDLMVIGAGSGGTRAARIAGRHGARVAICEESRYGGTCVIRGCVPKKLLVYGAAFRDAFEDARGFGWDAHLPEFDWATLIYLLMALLLVTGAGWGAQRYRGSSRMITSAAGEPHAQRSDLSRLTRGVVVCRGAHQSMAGL